jgi:hypothetical protein
MSEPDGTFGVDAVPVRAAMDDQREHPPEKGFIGRVVAESEVTCDTAHASEVYSASGIGARRR